MDSQDTPPSTPQLALVTPDTKQQFFSLEEARQILGVSEKTLRLAVAKAPDAKGYVPSTRVGRRVLIPRSFLFP